MTFITIISNVQIDNNTVTYRDFGFGKPVPFSTQDYTLTISLHDIKLLLKADVDEFVNDLKEDDDLSDENVVRLKEAGYPFTEKLISDYPKLFCNIIRDNLYFNILDRLLVNNSPEVLRYVINTLSQVSIKNDTLIITGEVYDISSCLKK